MVFHNDNEFPSFTFKMTALCKLCYLVLVIPMVACFAIQGLAQSCLSLSTVNENLAGNSLRSVAYNQGQYLAVGDMGTILTSADGQTWTTLDPGTTSNFVDVVWAGDRFAILGNGSPGPTILLSWNSVVGFSDHSDLFPQSFIRGDALGWDGSSLIIGLYDSLRGRPDFYLTSNYSTSTPVALPTSCDRINDIDTTNGLSIIGFDCEDFGGLLEPGLLMFTSDWTQFFSETTGPNTFTTRGIATNGTISFASSSFDFFIQPNTKLLLHSTNALTTAFTTSNFSNNEIQSRMSDADWVDPLFVAVTYQSDIGVSADGVIWQTIASPNQGALYRVVPVNNGQFVAVGEFETIILGSVGDLQALLPAWPDSVNCKDFINILEDCP